MPNARAGHSRLSLVLYVRLLLPPIIILLSMLHMSNPCSVLSIPTRVISELLERRRSSLLNKSQQQHLMNKKHKRLIGGWGLFSDASRFASFLYVIFNLYRKISSVIDADFESLLYQNNEKIGKMVLFPLIMRNIFSFGIFQCPPLVSFSKYPWCSFYSSNLQKCKLASPRGLYSLM